MSGSNVLTEVQKGTKNFVVEKKITTIYGFSDTLYAFSACKTTLESVTFEENSQLEVIQQYAFYQCTKLKEIDLSNCTNLSSIENNAFQYCTSATRLIFPNSLISIGENSCSDMSSITAVEIPSSLKTLSRKSFFRCTKLKNFTFAASVQLTELPYQFICHSLIQELIIPKSVISISNGAFEYASELINLFVEKGNPNFDSDNGVLYSKGFTSLVAFPTKHSESYSLLSTCKSILFASFSGTIIKNIDFSNNTVLQSIGEYAFQSTSIKSIEIPASVSSLGGSVFNKCSLLTNVTLSPILTSLQSYSFAYCGFVKFTVPENIIAIDSFCFSYNENLIEIILPSKLKTLGGGVFNGCPDTLKILFPDDSNFSISEDNQFIVDKANKNIFQYLGTETNAEIVIPNTITTIQSGAFAGSTNIKSISLEEGTKLQNILSSAFSYCQNLQTIQLSTITIIQSYAFQSCVSLKSIEFGSSIQQISSYAFHSCRELSEVKFPSSVTQLSIGQYTFYGCPIVSLTLPNGIQSIDQFAFASCTNLNGINFPPSLASLGSSCFSKSGIVSAVFDDNCQVTLLPESLFYFCSKLCNIHLHEKIQTIGELCFAGTKITNFIVPKSTQSIKDQAFNSCSSLESFSIPEKCQLNSLGYKLFSGCSSLRIIESKISNFIVDNAALYNSDRSQLYAFPPASDIKYFGFAQSVRTVSPGAFADCTNLEIIFIPDKSIETIKFNAFEGCTFVHTINIPKTVQTIENGAFSGCKNLRCGLSIDQKDPNILNQWVTDALLPEKCIHPCITPTCKHNTLFSHQFAFRLFVYILEFTL